MVSTRGYQFLTCIFFGLFGFILILSNWHDWDHFFSFFEAERRSWLLNYELPLWSNQVCAGVTRLGDPQSFGLSPFFLFVLAFGSFWGAKILVFICAVLGHFSLSRSLILIFKDIPPIHLKTLSLFFVMSSFFLWKFHVGHVTVALVLFSLMLVYYALKGALDSFSRKDFILCTLSTFSFLTAGFYYAAIFFLLPLLLALFCLAAGMCIRGSSRKLLGAALIRSRFTFGAFALGVLLASYKWMGILNYQNEFPRMVKVSARLDERAFGIYDLLTFHFSPIHRYRFLIDGGSWRLWEVWEYAAFSALPFLAIFSFWLILKIPHGIRKLFEAQPYVMSFVVVLILICFSFFLGDESHFSAYQFINEYVFNKSVRVTGRFLGAFQIGLLLLIPAALSCVSHSEKVWKTFSIVGSIVTFISLAMVLFLGNIQGFVDILSLPQIKLAEMNEIEFAQGRSENRSFMYAPVLKGRIVPNCYEPLRRGGYFSSEFKLASGEAIPFGSVVPFASNISDSCRASVRVTQNQLLFDESLCQSEKFCVHLNHMNIYKSQTSFHPKPEGGHCRSD